MVTVEPEIVATDSLKDVYVIGNSELALASKVKVKGWPFMFLDLYHQKLLFDEF